MTKQMSNQLIECLNQSKNGKKTCLHCVSAVNSSRRLESSGTSSHDFNIILTSFSHLFGFSMGSIKGPNKLSSESRPLFL